MSHACTTAGDERGVWAYCADCDWLGPVYTVDQPREREFQFWFDAYLDIHVHLSLSAGLQGLRERCPYPGTRVVVAERLRGVMVAPKN